MATGINLSSDDLGKLIPFSLSICHWLKDQSPWYFNVFFIYIFIRHAADCYTLPFSNKMKTNVEQCLQQVLQSIDGAEFELTNAQVRYILSQYETQTWAFALKIIICKAKSPAVIEDKIKKDLVEWAYHFLKDGGDDWNDLFQEAGKTLSNLGHISFQVFGEFCSMIRDCSQKVGTDVVAQVLGEEVLHCGKMNKERKKAAGILFKQLVVESSRLFGQTGTKVGTVSFGIRSKDEVTQWNLVHYLPEDKKAMQDLRTFYSCIDKKFVGIVEDLFEYHDFVDIAEAINNKYGMIPAPWKTTLNKKKNKGERGLKWFDYSSIKTPTPGASKHTKAKNNDPIIQRQPTNNDLLVNAFVDGEVNYYRRLSALGKFYVKKIKTIADRGGPPADALLLSSREIDVVFGLRFQKILDMTHTLLTNIEVINLTRKPVNSKTSREQILAKVVKQIANTELVDSYARYSSTYPQVSEVVKQKHAMRELNQKRNVRKQFPDFFDIWHMERKHISNLQQKRLEEVLELPVKRIHNYREIIKQLLGNCDAASVKYKDLYNAYTAIKKAADGLTALSEVHAQKMQY